jgi:hypothetical protein
LFCFFSGQGVENQNYFANVSSNYMTCH